MGVTAFSGMGVITANAQDYTVHYSLYIGDVQVTNKNYNDILNNGVFKYSPSDNKLTISGDFTGKYIDALRNKQAISSDINNLTIEVKTDSNINGNIRLNEDTTITGSGHLHVEYDNLYDVALRCNKTLKFVDADVSVNSKYVGVGWGSASLDDSENTIVINHSRLDVKSSNEPAVSYKNIVLKDSCIENPVGGYTAAHYICTSSSNAAQEVLISPVDKYGIEIDDVPVTNVNSSDVMGDGKVTYDADTKTLTLKGGTYSYINNTDVEGLTINVADDTTVRNSSSSNNYGKTFEIDEDTTITGKGKLTIDAVSVGIKDRYDSTLTIKNANIDIVAPCALEGPEVDKGFEKLIIINSALNINSSDRAISEFNYGIVLKNCKIVTPEIAIISDRGNVYESDGKTFAKVVKIKPIGVKGDVTGDGKIAVTDITKVAAHIKGKKLLTEEQQALADIDGNGKINVTDLTRIAAHVKGKKLIV